MQYEASEVGVVFELPEGCDVSSDGSVFGPDGLEVAVYVESPEETPATDLAFRREIAEGRSAVADFSHEETTADGWLLRFTTEDGEFGFELGRSVGGRRLVFWGDRLPDSATLELAIEACRGASAR